MNRSERFLPFLPAVVLLCFLLPLWNGFTDDGFIHIQYARNIVDNGEYAFNPGEVSFGTSSPLWVMLLAAAGTVVGPGDALIWVSRLLSWMAGFGSLIVVALLVRRLGGGRLTAWLCACTLAADVWFARWTALSMESSLAALAVLLMAWAATRAHENTRDALLTGVFMGLAALIRPELYLAAPVFALSMLSLPGGRRHRLWVAAGVAAALVIPWFVFARIHIGSFIPNTAGAKSGGLVVSPVVFAAKLIPVAKILLSAQAVAIAGAITSVLVLRARSPVGSPRARFAVLWVIALPITYVLFDIQILSRYLLLVAPVLCALGWMGFDALLANRAARVRTILLTTIALVGITVGATFYARVVVPPSRAFTEDLFGPMTTLARHLNDAAPADAVVAAADIGYLAFYGNRRVLDLGGLVEPATGVLRSAYDYEDIVDRGLYFDIPGYPHVDYFIDRDLQPDRFDGVVLAGHRFTREIGVTVRNLGIRKPGPYYYVLYKLERVTL